MVRFSNVSEMYYFRTPASSLTQTNYSFHERVALRINLPAGEVLISSQSRAQSIKEYGIRYFSNIQTSFIKHGKNPLMGQLHEITNYLVVEVINLERNSIETIYLNIKGEII